MSTRKEEERNEKIIRGLMKLPPNRRCINCDSQGPQYVCTNFWTFICIACSGIHRGFTHRVKSVSMSKFSSQEVDALQKGGNQRAREIYLKNWDMQSQKLPSSSNVEKIKEFIKTVYVDKKYAGGRSSDKPPRDLQSHKSGDEEHRRASSYHSFSQSPPYDHQYEDRLYGKQNHMLTRKPGSERGLYDGKLASFLYSPGRKREELQEDKFANEGSAPRFSDFSVSSSGEAFESGVQSPNFQRDMGTAEPPSKLIREILIEDAENQKQGLHPDTSVQRVSNYLITQTRTEESFNVSDGKPNPVNSATSLNLFDCALAPVNPDDTQTAKVSVIPLQPSDAVHTLDDDLFGGSVNPASAKFSAESLDLFAGFDAFTSASSAEVDMFSDKFHQTSCMPSSSQNAVSSPPPFVENEGWAQFDVPQFPVTQIVEKSKPSSTAPSFDEMPRRIYPQILSSHYAPQLPPEQSVFSPKSSSTSNKGHLSTQTNDLNPQGLPTLQWDAFSDFFGSTPQSFEALSLKDEVLSADKLPSSQISHTELDLFENSSQDSHSANQILPTSDGSLHQASSVSMNPLGGGATQEKKSVNPFDFPFESDLELGNMVPDSFLSNAGQSWHFLPYMPPVPPGYTPGMASSSQLGDLPLHGSGVSMGGNPFAPQPSPSLANLSVQGVGPSMSGNPFA